jgi:hypothetical protein
MRSDPEPLPVPELFAGGVTYENAKSRNFDNVSARNTGNLFMSLKQADSVRIIVCHVPETGQFVIQCIKSMDHMIVRPSDYEHNAKKTHIPLMTKPSLLGIINPKVMSVERDSSKSRVIEILRRPQRSPGG